MKTFDKTLDTALQIHIYIIFKIYTCTRLQKKLNYHMTSPLGVK